MSLSLLSCGSFSRGPKCTRATPRIEQISASFGRPDRILHTMNVCELMNLRPLHVYFLNTSMSVLSQNPYSAACCQSLDVQVGDEGDGNYREHARQL